MIKRQRIVILILPNVFRKFTKGNTTPFYCSDVKNRHKKNKEDHSSIIHEYRSISLMQNSLTAASSQQFCITIEWGLFQ